MLGLGVSIQKQNGGKQQWMIDASKQVILDQTGFPAQGAMHHSVQKT